MGKQKLMTFVRCEVMAKVWTVPSRIIYDGRHDPRELKTALASQLIEFIRCLDHE